MIQWVHLSCSNCGADLALSLRAVGQWACCRGCQAPIRVPALGKLVSSSARVASGRRKDSFLRIWALGAVAALVLATTTWSLVQRHERAKAVDRANRAVAAQVEAARIEVARQRWDEAAALLQPVLATELATDLDEARALWAQIRQEQAATALRAAEAALAKRDTGQALALLRAYLEDGHGAELERASHLKEQLELATSDKAARAFLHRLPDAALADFARTGMLADPEDITHPDARSIRLDKVRAHLPAELREREEEYARRVQRIRTAPAFGELQDFVARARHRLVAQGSVGKIDYKLLARLFRELRVNDPAEQQRIITGLGARQLDYGEAEKISQKRANLKERFHTYKDFDKTDWEIFDQTVDRELDGIPHDLQIAQ